MAGQDPPPHPGNGDRGSAAGLGTVDHSLPGNELDPNDDGEINIETHGVRGLRMPDAIASFETGGASYFLTANEGDSRGNAGDLPNGDTARVGASVIALAIAKFWARLVADSIEASTTPSDYDAHAAPGPFARPLTGEGTQILKPKSPTATTTHTNPALSG